VDGVCSTHGNCEYIVGIMVYSFCRKMRVEESMWKTGLVGSVILKWMLKKYIWLRRGTNGGLL
jgi:hypothetical protein